MYRWLFALAFIPSLASAEIYKCEVDGRQTFSDSPCGDTAERVEVDPVTVGGRLDSGTNVETYKPPKRERASSSNDCPFINSTEMRRLRIENRVVAGMKPGDVRATWGAPTATRTARGFIQWAYRWDNGNRQYVYFQNGCVNSISTYDRF